MLAVTHLKANFHLASTLEKSGGKMAIQMLQLPTLTSMGRPTSRAVIACLPDGAQEQRIQFGVGGRSVFINIKKTQGYKCHHKASARVSLGGHLTAPPSLPTTCLVKGGVPGVGVRM